MWLDRFSGQSTPAGATTPHRPYSPSPRKSSHLLPGSRLGLGSNANRSLTSLDLSANTSTASLIDVPRNLNGSALKYEQKPPSDVPDPLNVLKSILNVQEDASESTLSDPGVLAVGMASKIDFGGLSLQDFASQEEISIRKASIGASPQISANESRKKYEDFHNSISESDQVLQSVEAYLTNFKAELAQVSAEIENLQARSAQLTTRLENRRQVERVLGPAVEDATISPATVRAVAEGPIDDLFVKALQEVENRSKLIEGKKESADSTKAMDDVKPLLADLKALAIERIRDFHVAQIKALRSPNINAQIVQQQKFVRHKDLFAFLARNHPVLAEEIAQAYINTMKWYYSSHFTRYVQALEKIPLYAVDQYDLMGAEPAPARRNVLTAQKTALPQHDTFGLGKRGDIVKVKNETALSSYLAGDTKSTQHLELPFWNFNQALVDNVSAEYSVATELFSTYSYQQVARKVMEIFEPTFTIGHNLCKHLTENTTDCLGILICVRLNQHFAFELQRRKIPVADSYINYNNILLWPRFQMIMDQHRESLKKVPTSANRGAAAAFTLVGGNDPSKASLAPHAITQRFGQFLHGILSLSAQAGDDEPIGNSLGRLRTEYEALMSKLGKGLGDSTKRNRFLLNNYSLVLTIISDTHGKLANEQKEHFETLVKDIRAK